MANLTSVTKFFPKPKEGFVTTLASSILSSATTVPLNSTSGLTNGDVFVGLIEPGQTNEQCFTGTVDTAGNQITNVVWTTGANVAHSAGVTIVDYVTSTTVGMISKGVLQHANQDGSLITQAVKDALGITTDPGGGWNLLDGGAPAITSVTYNGNRSYTIVFGSNYASTLSPGMRLRTTRTVAAQTVSLDRGSSAYLSRASASVQGMSFTNNFVVSGWVKLTGYGSTFSTIFSRYSGGSGWRLYTNASGQVVLGGWNGNSANYTRVVSYMSLPLNKWVHVAAQLDMTVTTNSASTNYVMIDGTDVPAFVEQGGSLPTSLVQAGDLEVATSGGGVSGFSGYIAQVAVYSAKVTQTNVRATISQGILGSETSLISAYTCDSLTDLNTSTANTLTNNNSANIAYADSPFGGQADKTNSSTLDYGIITKVSTNTVTVLAAEGCTIPTTGGISGVAYATVRTPYAFPAQRGKWKVESIFITSLTKTSPGAATWYNVNASLTIPIGEWITGYQIGNLSVTNSTNVGNAYATLSSSTSAEGNKQYTVRTSNTAASANSFETSACKSSDMSLSSATQHYILVYSVVASATSIVLGGANASTLISAECAYL